MRSGSWVLSCFSWFHRNGISSPQPGKAVATGSWWASTATAATTCRETYKFHWISTCSESSIYEYTCAWYVFIYIYMYIIWYNMYLCIYMYVCIDVYVYICICMYICVCVRVCVYMHIVHIYTHVHTVSSHFRISHAHSYPDFVPVITTGCGWLVCRQNQGNPHAEEDPVISVQDVQDIRDFGFIGHGRRPKVERCMVLVEEDLD